MIITAEKMTASTSAHVTKVKEHISKFVFTGLCQKIGTSLNVAMRRDVIDTFSILEDKVRTSTNYSERIMVSGSHGEGFRRLDGSDMDFMNWPTNFGVIWDFSHIQYFKTSKKVNLLVLCDYSESPPGYASLYVRSLRRSKEGVLSADDNNDMLMIKSYHNMSSSLFKEFACISIMQLRNHNIHGPCARGKQGPFEYDMVPSIFSHFWPPFATQCLDRCNSWPKPHIAQQIIKNGCHFVAIGHKLGGKENTEWRISFSLAEQALVYSMNHCQFLLYGLMKIFLREVINDVSNDEDKLLCSYHIKTAVFWVLQQNTSFFWCPQNLLSAFWMCFKLILKWVYEGTCPNFFIPENNMFLTNIYGSSQKNLFTRLYGLYEKGLLSSLLQCPTIRKSILASVQFPSFSIFLHEFALLSEAEFDTEQMFEIMKMDIFHKPDIHKSVQTLHFIEQLLKISKTPYQVIILQKLTTTILQCIAFILYNKHTKKKGSNKSMYNTDKMSCHMLKFAAKTGCISDMLYIAMFYYRTFRYKKALTIIEMTKVKLARPYLMYREQTDTRSYSATVGGQPWSTKMREAIALDLHLYDKICYIDELPTGHQIDAFHLHIPPIIMLHMLDFLCNRQVNELKAQKALHNLETLLHRKLEDIEYELRDIAWHILGICQQESGHFVDALLSYQQSLEEYHFHDLDTMTKKKLKEMDLNEVQYKTICADNICKKTNYEKCSSDISTQRLLPV